MPDASSLLFTALIQGITEFLPVSSSGHLILLPVLSGYADQGQFIDVAAHIGTLAAVMIYLRADITAMAAGLFGRGTEPPAARHLILLLIIASLPVIAAGLLVEVFIGDVLRLVLVVAIANIVFALWLGHADKRPVTTELCTDSAARTVYNWQQMRPIHAFYIGCAQILALIPGASRSGVTMSMARQLGFDRLGAARFSLLLSLPVIAGAGLVKTISVLGQGMTASLVPAALVAGLSFIFALAAIYWMMGWLSRADFRIFVWYRLGLGAVLVVLLATGYVS